MCAVYMSGCVLSPRVCAVSLQASRKAPECAPGFRVACNKWLILVRRGEGGPGRHTPFVRGREHGVLSVAVGPLLDQGG